MNVGDVLGPYRVLGKLGEGGMGEVYRARDQKLGRDVAIKILSEAFGSDPDRLGRFEREARVLAALNHPNIGAIYGFEERPDGVTALVLEFVDGETLAARLRRGPLPIGEAIAIARQIAAALQAAHDKGIVHRDLKPANIGFTRAGVVKVLDFGLATAFDSDLSSAADAPTIAFRLTQDGIILGTPAYMSPEQLRGQIVDSRADVWGFGCVLFEMLTGTQPFRGSTLSDLIAVVLARDPDWTTLPAATPSGLRRLLERCLAKDAAERLRDIGEVYSLLDQDAIAPGTPATRAASGSGSRRVATFATLAVLAIAGVVAAAVLLRGPDVVPSAANDPPLQLTNFNDSAHHPALSPDGRMLTFIRGGVFGTSAFQGQVYVKLLPTGEPVQLTRDVSIKETPVFSPDGSRIVYTSVQPGFRWDSWQVPVLGGAPQPFLPNASGLSWLDDRRLLYAEQMRGAHMGITTSTESRSEHRRIYVPPGEVDMAHRAARSPDGKSLLIVEMDGFGWTPCRLLPFDGSTTGRQVGPPAAQCTSAAWSPDGNWMYFSSNANGAFHLWRQRFPAGAPEQITFGPTEQEGTAISADGRYLVTSMGLQFASVWLQGAGGEQQLTTEAFAMLPTLAPAGDRIFYLVRGPSGRAYFSGELWSVTLTTGQKERVLPGRVMTTYAISADGSKVVFATAEGESDGIWIADLGRRTPPVQLTRGGEYRVFFGAPGEILYLSPGERRYLFRMKEDGSGREQISDPVAGLFSVSPDGEWAAVLLPRSEKEGGGTQPAIISLHGGRPFALCSDTCAVGAGPNRAQGNLVAWSADGSSIYVSLQYFPSRTRRTVVLPYRARVPFERQYPKGLRTETDVEANPGAKVIPEANVFPASGSSYLFWRQSTQSNLYRIPIPQ
jgi:serine/threonine protein kinase/Tol biopolymer transport system component